LCAPTASARIVAARRPSGWSFDRHGSLLRAWGGRPIPGFVGRKCKAEDGCIWPNVEHGIYVDQKDNVWDRRQWHRCQPGDKEIPGPPTRRRDGFILKFDMNGNFHNADRRYAYRTGQHSRMAD